MTVEFVRADALRNVHARLIEMYGGLPGLRDVGALESAVARPQQLQHYEGVQSIPRLAAALSWALLRNHPFSDGNKRVAFASLTIFYNRNGFRLTCSEAEETARVMQAAGGAMTEDDWTAWLESVSAPREQTKA